MKIADLMAHAKRLRLRKSYLRLRPRLVYLVDTTHGYCHPNRQGFTSGQTAWSDQSLWFQCHKDAREHADTLDPWLKPTVLKLNVCAFEEPIAHSEKPPASDAQTV